jgi:hypothetical protein
MDNSFTFQRDGILTSLSKQKDTKVKTSCQNGSKTLAFVSNFYMLKNSLLCGDIETALFG